MFDKTRTQLLLLQLDLLIQKYDQVNPEVAKDLRAYKETITDCLRRGKTAELAKAALRLSVWIKFIMDHWSDG